MATVKTYWIHITVHLNNKKHIYICCYLAVQIVICDLVLKYQFYNICLLLNTEVQLVSTLYWCWGRHWNLYFLTEVIKKKKKVHAKQPHLQRYVYHHVVDFLDGQTQPAGLESCGEIWLQHCLKINSLVEVVASDLWQVLREVATALQDGFGGDRRGVVCHLSWKKKKKKSKENASVLTWSWGRL